MRRLSELLLPFMFACGVSEDKFAIRLAEYTCERYENCDQLGSWDDDIDACIDEFELAVREYVDNKSCRFDRGVARDCLDELEDSLEECGADPAGEEISACQLYCGEQSG